MLTPEQEQIRDSIMHPNDDIPKYEFSSVELGDSFIDFFVTPEYVYQRIYNYDRTEFIELLIQKVV